MSMTEKLVGLVERVEKGGAEKYHAKNKEVGKLFARERIRLLVDPGSFVEEGKLANHLDLATLEVRRSSALRWRCYPAGFAQPLLDD